MPIIEATPNRLPAEGFTPPRDPRGPGRNPRPCLPASLYADGLVRAAAAVKPRGPVGGDFYRCDVRGRELRFIFGDACGRGAPAAQLFVIPGVPEQPQRHTTGREAARRRAVGHDRPAVLVVFSDGLSEATRQRRQFGEARIVDLVSRRRQASATALVYSLMSAVYEFTNGRQDDDMAVLVVQCLNGSEGRRRSWTSPTATIQA